MTEKDLLRGIGSLDAELVEEAEAYQAPPARHWGRWLAAAACVAIVAGVGWKVLPTLTTETKPPQTTNVTEPETDSTEENTGSVAADNEDTEQTTGETLGGVAIGMTPEEVEAILGSSYEVDAPRQLSEDYWDLCWYYSGLYVRFADQGEGWYVRELMAPGDSTMTLSTGIGVGSSREEILAAYPDASVSESEGIWSAQVKYEDSSLWIFHDAKNGNYINWIAHQYMDNEKNSTWIATSSQTEPADPLTQESIGGLTLGMTEQEVEDVLGSDYDSSPVTELRADIRTVTWRYEGTELQLADTGDGWFLNEIVLLESSPLTLSTGIGMDATEAEIREAYPDVIQTTQDTDPYGEGVAETYLSYGDVVSGLHFFMDGETLYRMELGPLEWVPDPLWQSMVSVKIAAHGADGSLVILKEKAAKTVSTVLTVSDPELAENPGESPQWWLDFGNDVFVAVYGHDDLATVYTGQYLDKTLATMTEEWTGVYLDLDSTLQSALENPTETWVIG